MKLNKSTNQTFQSLDRNLFWDYADRMNAFYIQTGTAEPSQYVQYCYNATGYRVMKVSRVQGGGGYFKCRMFPGLSPDRPDTLAVLMNFMNKLDQKLIYMHNNPLHQRWNLVEKPELYPWSSAKFYETGKDDFGFLTHCKERFG